MGIHYSLICVINTGCSNPAVLEVNGRVKSPDMHVEVALEEKKSGLVLEDCS